MRCALRAVDLEPARFNRKSLSIRLFFRSCSLHTRTVLLLGIADIFLSPYCSNGCEEAFRITLTDEIQTDRDCLSRSCFAENRGESTSMTAMPPMSGLDVEPGDVRTEENHRTIGVGGVGEHNSVWKNLGQIDDWMDQSVDISHHDEPQKYRDQRRQPNCIRRYVSDDRGQPIRCERDVGHEYGEKDLDRQKDRYTIPGCTLGCNHDS